MTLGQAAQSLIFFGLPVAVYAAAALWRSGLSLSEVGGRLGLRLGTGRAYWFALGFSVPVSLIVVWISPWTSGFKGSMIAPFVGASPTRAIVAAAFIYGFLATGFPEELLFRGLIAGALFRRLSFWKANVIQTALFMLPHLLILLVAPRLWPVVVCLPLVHGLAAGWLRHASGSIWPSVLFHALPNIAGALAVVNWIK